MVRCNVYAKQKNFLHLQTIFFSCLLHPLMYSRSFSLVSVKKIQRLAKDFQSYLPPLPSSFFQAWVPGDFVGDQRRGRLGPQNSSSSASREEILYCHLRSPCEWCHFGSSLRCASTSSRMATEPREGSLAPIRVGMDVARRFTIK